MKKLFSFAAAVAFSFVATAQIPNAGFENWTNTGTYNAPDSWDNLNAMTSGMSVYTCTKGTPGNPGTAYLKLVSKTVTGMGVMPGIATTGTINTSNMRVNGGFACTQRPQSLNGSWQYMGSGSDAGFVAAYLTKWNTTMNMRDTVAVAMRNLSGMQMSWANFVINFTYLNGNNPDTAQIILSASGMTPAASSYLYIDNLAFAGNVASIQENTGLISNLSVYPNPASDKIKVDLDLKKNSSLKIQLIDLTGKTVKETFEENLDGKITRTIELTRLAKGFYFLKIYAGNSIETKKISIE